MGTCPGSERILLFAPAPLFARWTASFRMGLAAFEAGLLFEIYFFMEPVGSMWISNMVDVVQAVSMPKPKPPPRKFALATPR